MAKQMRFLFFGTLMIVVLLFNAVGCIKAPDTKNTNQTKPSFPEAYTTLSVSLLQKCATNENTLLSPLSIMLALALTANGADGETKTEMEDVLGMPVDDLNAALAGYVNGLPTGETYIINIADSLWIKNGIQVKDDFLKKNTDYYNAQVFPIDFDQNTVNQINDWVKDKTDNMIPKIIDNIDENSILCLINTLLFEAKWEQQYNGDWVKDKQFTALNGTKKTVSMMCCDENEYLSDNTTTGFTKCYENGKYKFVALLPNQDVSLKDYISSLSYQKIKSLLDTADSDNIIVHTQIPKFEYSYDVKLKQVLSSMGMPSAFDGQKANFQRMVAPGNGTCYIDEVLHKTHIILNEYGTKAAAVTAVLPAAGCSPKLPKIKEVYLNRPFMYLIVDTVNNLPLFIGTVTDIEK